MFDLVLTNGKIVLSDSIFNGTIAVKDGKIAAILDSANIPEARKTINVNGNYIFPGAIDTHAHLNDPGYEWREDYEHGTAAAAIGGYTTVIDMPLQNEPALTNAAIFDKKIEKVSPNAYIDYCFWGGLVPTNLDDLKGLNEKGCVAFKSFIGPVSPDYASLNYGQTYEAMQRIQKFDGRAGFHCEDFSTIKWQEQRIKNEGRLDWQGFLDSRPLIAEILATVDIIEIAKATGCKAHICHVSHPDVAQRIKEAQQQGYDITAETCAHYLCFSEQDVIEKGPLFKCAPPLRSSSDVDKLWEYVIDGTFSGIASDHSPCSYDEKYNEILGRKINNVFDVWGGISGIQSCFQVAFYEGCVKRGVCPTVLANSMAKLPAKAFGIYGQKGDIRVGFDADFTIVDPNQEWEITAESLHYVNKMSAYVGKTGKGLPVCTIVRGQVIAENGQLTDSKGFGKLITKGA
ncbi:allantoinase [Cricetibacter osteomyelitidis]|uniref:allantoinase n=1 Tax=Cricetibacter osteomyelitidis TaxID=1521931 RepID=A0A4V2T266_9PAST|nr:allantoinase AllB [Cricetibacter osteomyelitidis]TCP96203.1 allantoinase [Cricetibacter osteomyelitidis]